LSILQKGRLELLHTMQRTCKRKGTGVESCDPTPDDTDKVAI